MPRSYPRVEESGRWKLTRELKQVPARWESDWAPNYRASRKPLFRNTFRFAWSSLAFPPDEAWGGPRRR